MKMSITRATLIVAALGFGASIATAQPLTSFAGAAPAMANNVVPAAYYTVKKHPKKWVYIVRVDGPRFRHKRAGYVYFYHGWWYSHPYWRMKPA